MRFPIPLPTAFIAWSPRALRPDPVSDRFGRRTGGDGRRNRPKRPPQCGDDSVERRTTARHAAGCHIIADDFPWPDLLPRYYRVKDPAQEIMPRSLRAAGTYGARRGRVLRGAARRAGRSAARRTRGAAHAAGGIRRGGHTAGGAGCETHGARVRNGVRSTGHTAGCAVRDAGVRYGARGRAGRGGTQGSGTERGA